MEKGETKKEKISELKDDSIAKITVTKEAEEAVSQAVMRVNDGFIGGKVNRQDMTSLLLIRACKNLNDEDISSIRHEFISDVALLEVAQKKVRETGKMSDSLREALMNDVGLSAVPKRSKKNLNDKYSNAIFVDKELE